MAKRKKSLFKKIIIALLIFIVVCILLVILFLFLKLSDLNNSVHNPLKREYSQLRDKPADKGDPISVVLYGIDDDEVRKQEGGGQRSDSIILLSINPKTKKQL